METSEAALTRDEALAWARDLYGNAVDHKDAAGFAAVFTDDAWLRFANAPPLVGREAIRAAIAQFFTAFAALRHEFVGLWCQDDAVICEATVTYTRHDGGTVTVPATTIFRLVGGEPRPARPTVHRCQIYVDLAPLFAPTGTSPAGG